MLNEHASVLSVVDVTDVASRALFVLPSSLHPFGLDSNQLPRFFFWIHPRRSYVVSDKCSDLVCGSPICASSSVKNFSPTLLVP